MKKEFWHILNERGRRERSWLEFRQWERLLNDRNRRNSSDERGRIRVAGDEDLHQVDNSEPERPLDGKLSW